MEKEKGYSSIFYRNLKTTFWGGKNTYFNKYWNLGISQRFKSQNFFFFLRFIRDNFFYINDLFTVLGSSMATPFQLCIFFFITGKMSFPTSLCYLTPCGITIRRALGPAQNGTFHYLRKACSKSNKTARIYIDRFFKFFLPRHPLSPPNLLLSPVVLVVWFWYAIKYLKVSHFSFPSTPILHECTVNNEGKYLSTHKIIRKNLQAIVSHIW